jgi:DNA-binding transcriptional LysR family regulator
MQMHQIRYFLALCEEGNFTRAAKRSGVSQPSLSNAIAALERELGGALFIRKPFTAMTSLGWAIQPYMQQIAHAADQTLQAAQSFGAAYVVPRWLPGSSRNLHAPDRLPEQSSRVQQTDLS